MIVSVVSLNEITNTIIGLLTNIYKGIFGDLMINYPAFSSTKKVPLIFQNLDSTIRKMGLSL